MKIHIYMRISGTAGASLLGLCAALFAPGAAFTSARAEVTFNSPGFPSTRMDDQARLVEDWGTIGLKFANEDPGPKWKVETVRLEQRIPAARAQADHGPIGVTITAYRAPAFPAGTDVLTVRLEEKSRQAREAAFSLELPDTVRLGTRTVTVGGRTVLSLPAGTNLRQETREWGWADDAVPLPGWAHPSVECDPAFRNIRAGMNGVPIIYRFKVEPKSATTVALGFCESHWAAAGIRPVLCTVEGAPLQEVDPIARWGRNKPGVVFLAGEDKNGDGQFEVAVLPKPGAQDQNPILNVLWLFPPGTNPNPDQVILGRMNTLATRFVDVGGDKDQSMYAGGTVEYKVKLGSGESKELTFLVAPPGGSVPSPATSDWTNEKLRRAALEVWRDWK